MSVASSPNGIFQLPEVGSAVDEDLWGGILNANFDIADAQTTTRAYDLDFADFTLSAPVLKDYAETLESVSSVSGSVTVDYSVSNHKILSLTGNVTNLTVSNPPATATRAALTLQVKTGSGGYTFTWPSWVKWGNIGAPTLTTTASVSDFFVLLSNDGFTTALGLAVAQGISGWV